MNEIYILIKFKNHKSQIKGPYTIEYIGNVLTSKEDLVWFKGLSDWTPVKDIPELKDIQIQDSKTPILEKNSFFKKLFKL